MRLNQAREECKELNEHLNSYNSYAKIVQDGDNGYTINIVCVDEEVLPSGLQKYQIVSESLTEESLNNSKGKQDRYTPSGAGKWIDMPLSPANRNYDGPGALSQRRRIPDLQDTVTRFAEGDSVMSKVAEKLIKIAKEMATVILFYAIPSDISSYTATPKRIKIEKGAEKNIMQKHIQYLKKQTENRIKKYEAYSPSQHNNISVITMKHEINALVECIRLQEEELKN